MRAQSILANLSFAVTVGVASYLVATQLDRGGTLGKKRNDGETLATEAVSGTSGARWLFIWKQTLAGIRNDRILSVAAGVTFYGLLALFPTVAAAVSLYGLIAESRHLSELLTAVDGALPRAGSEFLRNKIERIGDGQEATLTFALAASVALALWSANRGVKALFDGLNVAYGQVESRTFLRLNIISLTFTIGLFFFLILAIFLVAAFPLMFNSENPRILLIGRWPITTVVLLGSLEVLYRFGPSGPRHKYDLISPGAIVAALVWLTGSFLFSTFLANFHDYNRTFGTLAAVDILLVWMWLSSISILIGAEFNGQYHIVSSSDPNRTINSSRIST